LDNPQLKEENDMTSKQERSVSNAAANTGSIYYKDATELATLIRTKQLSSREIVQAHLDRIAAVNPKVNAIVTLMADSALQSADAADKAVASGIDLGPFHGIDSASIQDLCWKYPCEGRHRCHAFQGGGRDSVGEDQSS
jgi:TRAP-type uncharacterized transport system substrate-binding protein